MIMRRGYRQVRQGYDGREAAGGSGTKARDGREGRGPEEPRRATSRGRRRGEATTAQEAEGRAAVSPSDRKRAI